MDEKIQNRQNIEKEYHNKKTREGIADRRAPEGEAYNIFWKMIGNVSGLRILDFGCGDGWMSIWLAKQGAEVYGIDISDGLVTKARKWADEQNLSKSITLAVMTGEDLKFPDVFFDLIIGSAVLHHTDIEHALKGISRVLKPSGRAIFIEPMNQNIVLKIWRALTPWRRSLAERALAEEDLELIRRIFSETKLYFFTLFSIATAGLLMISSTNKLLLLLHRLFERLDKMILANIPSLGKYSAVVVMDLRK